MRSLAAAALRRVLAGGCRQAVPPVAGTTTSGRRWYARANSGAERRQAPMDLSGVFPPIATPFAKDGSVAWDELSRNLSKWEEVDFSGYVLMGSNGEAPLLHVDEKVRLVRHVRAAAKSHKLVLAGAGAESTADTIDLCRRLADAGADAALVITPSFYKASMTPEALKQHYLTVADQSPMPVILYSVPANTGVDLPADTVLQLAAAHPNVVALKDSGGDIGKIAAVTGGLRSAGSKFQVLAGSAGFLLPAVRLGAVGGVLAAANCLGADCVRLYQLAVGDDDREAANRLQHKLLAPNAAVTRQLGVPALKYAMDALGYYGGPVRPPLLPLTQQQKDTVKRVFENAGYTMTH